MKGYIYIEREREREQEILSDKERKETMAAFTKSVLPQ
jgi:hypothetical protein